MAEGEGRGGGWRLWPCLARTWRRAHEAWRGFRLDLERGQLKSLLIKRARVRLLFDSDFQHVVDGMKMSQGDILRAALVVEVERLHLDGLLKAGLVDEIFLTADDRQKVSVAAMAYFLERERSALGL
ncbi:MAG: hypothetical protein HYV08_08340 [Deltaproteobacteria bacterium]|nr:hypothetical protein [Deltaproteobacteria bacterium]